jgi:hypothetical protein
MKYALIVAAVALASCPASSGEAAGPFDVSYAAGMTDAAGRRMGGTEIRNLVADGGKLFAANGYWKDTDGLTNSPGPQILILDGPGKPWRIEHEFDERMPRGRRRHIAISVLERGHVPDRSTRRRSEPACVPVAGIHLGRQRAPHGFHAGQCHRRMVRRFHRAEPAGAAFPAANPLVRVSSRPPDRRGHRVRRRHRRHIHRRLRRERSRTGPLEHHTGTLTVGLGAGDYPGLSRGLRISSFAEAGGRLFAAIGQQVWVREDGPTPLWVHLYTNPNPHFSETGMRGLTAVMEPGGREFLLAAVEGMQSRIVRIDPDRRRYDRS